MLAHAMRGHIDHAVPRVALNVAKLVAHLVDNVEDARLNAGFDYTPQEPASYRSSGQELGPHSVKRLMIDRLHIVSRIHAPTEARRSLASDLIPLVYQPTMRSKARYMVRDLSMYSTNDMGKASHAIRGARD